MSLLEIAKKYRDAGLSVIPCYNKRPVLKTWTEYQEARPTEEELIRLFNQGRADQIGLICGAVSGSLEVIDIDLKNDTTGILWDLLWNDLVEYFNNYMPLLVVNTKSGGVHLYYRCEFIERSQKIAYLAKDTEAVIETRGEKGYVICPPSLGYTFANPEQDLTCIQTITIEQRGDVLDICRKYNKVFTEVKKKASAVQASAYFETPWDAYNNDPDEPWAVVMSDAGWTESHVDRDGRIHYQRPGSENKYGANWDPSKRLLYVFTPNGGFEPSKAYSPAAIYARLKCDGDFSKAANELRAAGYGVPFSDNQEKMITKAIGYNEKGLLDEDIIRMMLSDWDFDDPSLKDLGKEDKEKKIKDDIEVIQAAALSRIAASKGLFWKTDKKGKVLIAKDGLVAFLRGQGFKLFVQEENSLLYRVVRITTESRIIKEVPEDEVMKWVEQWIYDNIDDYDVPRGPLLLAVMDFKEWPHFMKWMPRLSLTEVSFLRDTKSASYIPFKNGIVHITKDDIQIIPYSGLPEGVLVWKNQIKTIEIELMGIEKEIHLNETPVYRFMKRIAGITPDLENIPLYDTHEDGLNVPGLVTLHPNLNRRMLSFMTTSGYLMSNYKDPGRPYAVILAEDTASDRQGGGAGKDLLMKCYKWVRGISFLPGKLWKATANFAFQTYKMGDDILYIGDPPKFFDFELLYNTITEGLTVEKKNKDALVIPFELSPKVVISTNFMIDDVSDHAARRQVKLLFTKYYNKYLRVEDELGGQFWSPEWTHRDWMMFYLLMFTCIQTYLDMGIVVTDTTENSREKGVKQNYGDEFFGFMADWIKENSGKWVEYKELYRSFLTHGDLEPNAYKSNRFSYGLEFYASTYGFELNDGRFRVDGSDKKKYVIFTTHGSKLPEFKAPVGLWA